MQFLQKARDLMPQVYKTIHRPVTPVELTGNPNALHGIEVVSKGTLDSLYSTELSNGDSFILDFGNYLVGYLTLKIKPLGHQQDSPLRLRLLFAEMPCEITDEPYTGALSSTWIQEEIINIDTLALPYSLPRRYAFRYLKIEIQGRCTAYRVKIEDIYCTSITSSNTANIKKLPQDFDPVLAKIDATAIKTLQHCSQEVFEDGPKRDRRLWLGDLTLQVLADSYTFNNNDLVKRCLYLFAGLPHGDGQVSSCIFHEPTLKNDSWILNDYSLFFITTLHNYFFNTNDMDFAEEMWNTAFRQAQIISGQIDDNGIVQHGNTKYFIDWCTELDKTAAAQGVVIYTFKQGLALAKSLGKSREAEFFQAWITRLSESAIKYLYNSDTGFFESGDSRQVSWQSQVWMVIAGVFDKKENTNLIKRLISADPSVRIRTPYMYHYLIQSLFDCDLKEEALKYLKQYWGQMCDLNADCFWEVFAPEDLYLSPYGSHRINSYCHAWSCTPTYFIRKYLI